MPARMHACKHVSACVRVRARVYACVCMCVCLCMCVCVCVCVHALRARSHQCSRLEDSCACVLHMVITRIKLFSISNQSIYKYVEYSFQVTRC